MQDAKCEMQWMDECRGRENLQPEPQLQEEEPEQPQSPILIDVVGWLVGGVGLVL